MRQTKASWAIVLAATALLLIAVGAAWLRASAGRHENEQEHDHDAHARPTETAARS